MKYKKLMIGTVLALALLTPVVVSGTTAALFDNAKDQACQGLGGCDANPSGGLNALIKNIINLLSIIIGIVSVVMIMLGGFKYITSAGDSSKAAGARSTIMSALIGLVIVALAQFIVQFVLNRTTTTPGCSKDAIAQTDGSYKEPSGSTCKK